MDLHPEEAVLSGPEDEEREHSDQDLKIRRTVTQVSLLHDYPTATAFLFVELSSVALDVIYIR